MSIRVALNHVTHYKYDRPVQLTPHVVRLRPAPHCRTPIHSYSLRVSPGDHFLNWQQDPYSNYLARFVFAKPTRELRVEVDLIADMTVVNPFDFFIEPDAEKFPFQYDPLLSKELVPYREVTPPSPKLYKLVHELRRSDIRCVDYLVEINVTIQKAIKYLIRLEPGVQTPEETLTLCSGSCRDSAWLLVQLLRNLGFAARFVSGYLIQLVADEKALDGPSGTETDFTDLHAWAEVYLPGAGWIGMDPTSGLFCGEGHIPLACSAEPITAAAITGAFDFDKKNKEDEVKVDFSFEMSVKRIVETPRVTKPYTTEQWTSIDRTGHHVDQLLKDLDVRLTMGGEPTFVSIDDRDGAEWNTEALGPHKRSRAGELFRRLRDRFAPGGLLHFGQGKWYPGEQLPRWALGCFWRKDGTPIWQDPKLVAEDDRNYNLGPDAAEAFVRLLAKKLEVPEELAIPGYEDAFYYMWKERQLPTNVDPLKNKIEDEMERERIAKIFDQGLKRVVGYTLPIRRRHDAESPFWEGGKWFIRRENLFLTPGDSPMGYRMPLDSLLWEPAETRDIFLDPDPTIERQPLPGRSEYPSYTFQIPGVPTKIASKEELAKKKLDAALVRTALCVEPREGKLKVFMPPQKTAEDYLDLIAAVESTAHDLRMPIHVEGYTPPSDARLTHFLITPDPGVIEVNIHPANSWDELKHQAEVVYEEARQSRLCTEKFMHDGKHVGTGGGNHFVLGGASPLDSPILRRPDLLKSLVAYWHNHPSLSYLFSGLFVGPTSQAPRIDEARNDSVYELEIAMKQVPHPGQGYIPPWLVDRVFRHLLVDVTGNTHRSEFCIDKLYTQDVSSGRRGLLELRSFEMPPHREMSMVQQLLLRSFVAKFWKEPYEPAKLVRWGTELHDRFLLPHFVQEDFKDVMEDFRSSGIPMEDSWFAPHFEFRFPVLGEIISPKGIELELRGAIEPWNVLGEEPGATGTTRFVDSSVERLQLKINGLVDSRHVITCNGRPVPLTHTGVNGEYVAGVRYRAWQPPSCLHPTIGVHSPLIFDIFDLWMGRSIGGCTYHVKHPGGRSYDIAPVNANEAQGRRISRFFPWGHTPGSIPVPELLRLAEAPITLDLRT
jgi:uncharacterized protein (DUF2126 family)/transglutaminase-like putative cysteine protease